MSVTWKYIKSKLDSSSTNFGGVYAFDTPVRQKPPYISFYLSDLDPYLTADSSTPQDEETWTIIISDVNIRDAIINADFVRTLLDHTSGTLEGVTVQQIVFIGRNIPLVEADAESDKVFRIIDTYQINR